MSTNKVVFKNGSTIDLRLPQLQGTTSKGQAKNGSATWSKTGVAIGCGFSNGCCIINVGRRRRSR